MESMFIKSVRPLLVVLAVFLCAVVLADQIHNHSDLSQKVGKVSFPISCSKTAQDKVEHGIALMHSFLFDDAEDQFKEATTEDSTCAMAYWAEAMGLYRPLAYMPTDADMKRGWELIQKAKTLNPKPQREIEYIEALAVLYRPDERAYSARNQQYSAAMEKLHKDFPNDTEAAVFYALSLLTLADSKHPLVDSKEAIAILDPIFRENPDHPGAAHYLIHAADSPQLAPLGLMAARRYAEIAPASPHALRMPSHIFVRLGLWQEDIQSNLASLKAAQNPSAAHVGGENQLHAMEFLEYAYLQIGEDEKAEEMVQAQTKIGYDQVDKNLHDYVNRTRANSPALYDLETRNWKAAEELKPDLDAETYNQAITYWAQAVAAGHLSDVATAQHAVNRYDVLLQATADGPQSHRAKSMATMRDEARAWLDLIQGKGKEATELLRAVADKQDANGKGEIELPAREMLADMLMQMNRPAEAPVEFEKSMKVDPNRFNGLYGAGRAAELLGEREKERSYYGQMLKNCAGAQSNQPELAHARASMLESAK
jgi:tetratricopeptide (TPR) repeat protein